MKRTDVRNSISCELEGVKSLCPSFNCSLLGLNGILSLGKIGTATKQKCVLDETEQILFEQNLSKLTLFFDLFV